MSMDDTPAGRRSNEEPWQTLEREQNRERERLAAKSLKDAGLAWALALYGALLVFALGVSSAPVSSGAIVAIVALALVIWSTGESILNGIRCLTAEGRAGRARAIAGLGFSVILLLGLAFAFWAVVILRLL